MIDQIIVGLLGVGGVAGVGLSNSVSFIVVLVYSAFGTGSGVLVAQAFGRNSMQEVSATAAVGQTVAGILGACTALPLMLFPSVILACVGAQEDVAKQAAGYFQLFAASAPFTAISAVTTATFRSLNDSRTPMIVTVAAAALNTLFGFFLVLGINPFPKLGVLGAGVAILSAQALRCLVLLVFLYRRKEGPNWRWPWQCSGTKRIFKRLFEITYPLALSEMLWGSSAFLYTLVFTRLGTEALAASQIAMVIENLFIVAGSGLAPAAVASIGQVIGAGSIRCAKSNAVAVLRLGAMAALAFAALLIGAGFSLPFLYPQIKKDVLQLAFWGILIAAFVQPAKLLNNIIGNGILPSGGDTKFVLATHVIGSYLVGLPAAVVLGIFWGLKVWVFGARAIEETTKVTLFVVRFCRFPWYQKSAAEVSSTPEQSA